MAFAQLWEPKLVAGDIPNILIQMAEQMVNQELSLASIEVPATDHNDYLKFGSLFFIIDVLSSQGKLGTASGRIIESTLGKSKTVYQIDPNRYSFRQIDARRGTRFLRDSDSPRMAAVSSTLAYINWYNKNTRHQKSISPRFGTDNTSYGPGWNEQPAVVAHADAESRGPDQHGSESEHPWPLNPGEDIP